MFLMLAVLEIVFPSNREWAVSGRLRGRTPGTLNCHDISLHCIVRI